MGWSVEEFVENADDIKGALMEVNEAFVDLNSELINRIHGTTNEEQKLNKLDTKYAKMGGMSHIAALGPEQANQFIYDLINDYDQLSYLAKEVGTTPEDMVTDFNDLLGIMDQVFEEQKKNQEELLKFAKDFRDYIKELKLGDLSILNPKQQLEEADKEYKSLVAKAKTGDVEALGKLQGAAQTLLEKGRDYYASGQEYTDMFNMVTGDLEGLAVDIESGKIVSKEDQNFKDIVNAIFGMDTNLLAVGDKLYEALTSPDTKYLRNLYDSTIGKNGKTHEQSQLFFLPLTNPPSRVHLLSSLS
jgi:hypothetical protein